MPIVNSKDPVYSVHEEPVPVKFYFYRRQHAAEFLAQLHHLGFKEAKLSQMFNGSKAHWVVLAGWQVLWRGPMLGTWFEEAIERWAPSEGKLA